MNVPRLSQDELRNNPDLGADNWPTVNRWLARGDGVACYRNEDLGHSMLGHHRFVSFGSPAAQLEVDAEHLPVRLPDIGGAIGHRYQLVGIYTGKPL